LILGGLLDLLWGFCGVRGLTCEFAGLFEEVQ
jgi:hypothetical protein